MQAAKPGKPVPIECRELRALDWPSVESLFGERGACGGCWCMYWRLDNTTFQKSKGAANKRAFKALVAKRAVHATLAFAGGEPVGWCCVGPYADFPRLEGARTLRRARGPGTWAVTCFFIRGDWRGKRVGTALLARACQLAFQRGAAEIEGYPVVVKPGKTMPGAFAWTGTEPMFAAAKFKRVPSGGTGRALYVKKRGRAA